LILHEDGVADFQEASTVTVDVTWLILKWRVFVEFQVCAEIIEDFTVWATWFAGWHVGRNARSRPPVFLFTVVENSTVLHAVFLGFINVFCFYAVFAEQLFPDGDGLAVTRNA
jgi:hypothetical protein